MARRLLAVAGLVAAAAVSSPALAGGETAVWDGWIVGAPCAADLRVADCPLRHVDDSVLLMEGGEQVAFRYGDGTAVSDVDVDGAYGKKVRLTGTLAHGRIDPVRMDLLEKSGAQKFFKGCL